MNFMRKFFMISFIVHMSYMSHLFGCDGKTEFMNYIIAQEVIIAEIEQKIDLLWHECYETVQINLDGLKKCNVTTCQRCQWVDVTKNEYGCELYKSLPYHIAHSLKHPPIEHRKASCRDQDIRLLNMYRDHLDKIIADAINSIEKMIESAVHADSRDMYHKSTLINAQDIYHKTALDYCTTVKIREALLVHGAYSGLLWTSLCRHSVAFIYTACIVVAVSFYYKSLR